MEIKRNGKSFWNIRRDGRMEGVLVIAEEFFSMFSTVRETDFFHSGKKHQNETQMYVVWDNFLNKPFVNVNLWFRYDWSCELAL